MPPSLCAFTFNKADPYKYFEEGVREHVSKVVF